MPGQQNNFTMKKYLLFVFLSLCGCLGANAKISGSLGKFLTYSFDESQNEITLDIYPDGYPDIGDQTEDYSNLGIYARDWPWYFYKERVTNVIFHALKNGYDNYVAAYTRSIGKYMFLGCSNLQHIYYEDPTAAGDSYDKHEGLPSTVTTIGAHAFDGCTKLQGCDDFFHNVQKIDDYAFKSCSSFATNNTTSEHELVLPSTVLSLGEHAFEACTGLTSVAINSSSITVIPEGAFTGCTNLKSVTLPTVSTSISIGKYAFQDCNNLVTVAPASGDFNLGEIGAYAFSGCSKLVNFNANNVLTIDEAAFYGCSSLTGFSGTNNGTTVGKEAFKGCTGLTSFALNGYGALGDGAFRNCENLGTVTLTTVGSIGEYAFSGCTKLSSVTMDDATTIGKASFLGCYGLASVSMPNVLSLADSAFKYCSALASVSMPKVQNLGASAFEECAALDFTSLPGTLTTIGTSCFRNCKSLGTANAANSNAALTIPAGVTSLGTYAFASCIKLKNVDLSQYTSTIPTLLFPGCVSLTDVNLNSNLTAIGERAFINCSKLESITLHDNLQTIGRQAFANTGLKSFTIPLSVTSVGAEILAGCGNLKYVIVNASTPPSTGGNDIFDDATFYSSVPLGVPDFPSSFLSLRPSPWS
jgi:hypothetical protein